LKILRLLRLFKYGKKVPCSSFETVDKPKIGQVEAFGGADKGQPGLSFLRFEGF